MPVGAAGRHAARIAVRHESTVAAPADFTTDAITTGRTTTSAGPRRASRAGSARRAARAAGASDTRAPARAGVAPCAGFSCAAARGYRPRRASRAVVAGCRSASATRDGRDYEQDRSEADGLCNQETSRSKKAVPTMIRRTSTSGRETASAGGESLPGERRPDWRRPEKSRRLPRSYWACTDVASVATVDAPWQARMLDGPNQGNSQALPQIATCSVQTRDFPPSSP